jgi:hypothetical protein
MVRITLGRAGVDFAVFGGFFAVIAAFVARRAAEFFSFEVGFPRFSRGFGPFWCM